MNKINITRIDLSIADIDLNNPDILGSSEAAEIWGVNPAYVRTSIKQTPQKWSKRNYRKFDRFLLVTSEGMESATGEADPRKVNAIESPSGVEMNYEQKESVYKNAKSRAFQMCKQNGDDNRINLNQYFQQALNELLNDLVKQADEKAHHLHFVTDTASVSIDVDGKEVLVSNGGIDGPTSLEIIEKTGVDSEWTEDRENGRFKTQLIEGNEIVVAGSPLKLSGRFQCWAQNNNNSANMWIVKQA